MNDYSYHTVSSIINAFEKSVNVPFKFFGHNVYGHTPFANNQCTKYVQNDLQHGLNLFIPTNSFTN